MALRSEQIEHAVERRLRGGLIDIGPRGRSSHPCSIRGPRVVSLATDDPQSSNSVVPLLIAGAVGGGARYLLRRFIAGEQSEIDDALGLARRPATGWEDQRATAALLGNVAVFEVDQAGRVLGRSTLLPRANAGQPDHSKDE